MILLPHEYQGLEPHPHKHMTLATSGLENDCKIWQSTAPESTVPGDLEELCRENANHSHIGPSDMMVWIQNFMPHYYQAHLADSEDDGDNQEDTEPPFVGMYDSDWNVN